MTDDLNNIRRYEADFLRCLSPDSGKWHVTVQPAGVGMDDIHTFAEIATRIDFKGEETTSLAAIVYFSGAFNLKKALDELYDKVLLIHGPENVVLDMPSFRRALDRLVRYVEDGEDLNHLTFDCG